jgi:hypothetical protein
MLALARHPIVWVSTRTMLAAVLAASAVLLAPGEATAKLPIAGSS